MISSSQELASDPKSTFFQLSTVAYLKTQSRGNTHQFFPTETDVVALIDTENLFLFCCFYLTVSKMKKALGRGTGPYHNSFIFPVKGEVCGTDSGWSHMLQTIPNHLNLRLNF